MIQLINLNYNLSIFHMDLIRERVGTVYKMRGKQRDYILKLYSKKQIESVEKTIAIIRYLRQTEHNSLEIIQTLDSQDFVKIPIDGIMMYGVVYHYIEGIHPNQDRNQEKLLAYIKHIHDVMKQYPGKIPYHGKQFYVNRCIELFIIKDYDSLKLIDLTFIARELYDYIEALPRSFCHGDFHSENIIMDSNGQFSLIDFDAANNASNLVDVATICDQTNFNHLTKNQFLATIDAIEDASADYRRFTNQEIAAMLAFIPIRHLEVTATIAHARGFDEITKEFMEEQYNWIKTYFQYFEDYLGPKY